MRLRCSLLPSCLDLFVRGRGIVDFLPGNGIRERMHSYLQKQRTFEA
jgi:hypothetical protein